MLFLNFLFSDQKIFWHKGSIYHEANMCASHLERIWLHNKWQIGWCRKDSPPVVRHFCA